MRKLLPTLLAMAVPAAAAASADSVPNVNTRDLGMAQSIVAAQDGAGAVFGNPAALSRLRGLEISLAGSLLDNATTWTSTTGLSPSPVSTRFKPAPPPALFAAYGGTIGERGWGVGLGMGIPEGGNVDWPATWPGRFDIVTVDRKVFGFYATGGIEVIPQVRLGGGLVYYRVTEYLKQSQDLLGNEIVAEVSTAGGGLSFDVSAEVTPFDGIPLTLAVDYKHKAHAKLEGDARFHGVPLALRPSLPDQGVTHPFTVPNSLNVGAAWRPIPELLLGFTWTMDRFQVYAEDRFTGDQGAEVVVPRNYGNGYTYRIGAEYALSPRWQVRAGLLRDITGLKTQYFSPSLPDGDVWAGAVGGTFRVNAGLSVHGAVFYGGYGDVHTTGLPPAFPGTWESGAVIYGLGLTWRLAP
ncbi:MAG TPA: outer membrane protein transport protein [Anaeromyxobacteraceae bacterium]|nr:outer membrane protein transport protein [Anaeromyxobacteraceae bacterium]